MAKSPAFRFYPSDFMGAPDVQAMDLHEVGAYTLLLCTAWLSERHGYLPDDENLLRRWAKMTREQWAESRALLMKKFPVVEDGWRANPRMVREAEKQVAFSASQSAKGAKGGRPPKKPGLTEIKPGLSIEKPDESQTKAQRKPSVSVSVSAADEGQEQKPSRVKKPREGPTKTDLAKSRHAEFKAAVGDYWKGKNPDVQMPWGPAEGRNIEMWMRESPQTTLEQFRAFLRNRWKSEVNHAERPSRWIGNVTGYAAGPLDKFGRPLNGGNNGTQSRTSPAAERGVVSRANIAESFTRRHPTVFGTHDGADTSALPQPGATAVDGGHVRSGVGGDDAKARPGDVPGRVIEGVA